MNTGKRTCIFLVDDDAVFLKLLEIELLQSVDFQIFTFATGELCIAGLVKKPDFIVLDYHLDGISKGVMNGLETLDKIHALEPGIPVIMLSSQDSIDIAINCMHHHAVDYVVKSETAFLRIQKIIATQIENKKLEEKVGWYKKRM